MLYIYSPSCSASSLPLSTDTILSSSMSHLFPARITWALSQEYVLIWVALTRDETKASRRACRQYKCPGTSSRTRCKRLSQSKTLSVLVYENVIMPQKINGNIMSSRLVYILSISLPACFLFSLIQRCNGPSLTLQNHSKYCISQVIVT